MRYLLVAMALLLAACRPAAQPPARQYFEVDPATASAIQGTVTFKGKRAPAKRISMDAEEACEKLHDKPVVDEPILVSKDGALANAFVYIKTGLAGKAFEPPKQAVVLDQRGCQFVPRVVGLRAGQTLAVKNSDPVSHNIHPMPQNNRDWNQQQPPQSPDLQRRFARPEIMIPVKCNIHAWMKTYIAVLDHPYFAVTGADGRFSMRDLPPGQYTVAVWHEQLGESTQSVTVEPSKAATVEFVYR